MGAGPGALLPPEWWARERPLEDHRWRGQLGASPASGLPGQDAGPHRPGHLHEQTDVIYALVEAEATEADASPSGLYRSADGGMSFEKMNGTNVPSLLLLPGQGGPQGPGSGLLVLHTR